VAARTTHLSLKPYKTFTALGGPSKWIVGSTLARGMCPRCYLLFFEDRHYPRSATVCLNKDLEILYNTRAHDSTRDYNCSVDSNSIPGKNIFFFFASFYAKALK